MRFTDRQAARAHGCVHLVLDAIFRLRLGARLRPQVTRIVGAADFQRLPGMPTHDGVRLCMEILVELKRKNSAPSSTMIVVPNDASIQLEDIIRFKASGIEKYAKVLKRIWNANNDQNVAQYLTVEAEELVSLPI